MLTIDRIRHAAEVLSSVIRRTDMIRAPRINCDSEIYLKTENLQVTGSFKVRGAYYKISQLTEEEKKRVRASYEKIKKLATFMMWYDDAFSQIRRTW